MLGRRREWRQAFGIPKCKATTASRTATSAAPPASKLPCFGPTESDREFSVGSPSRRHHRRRFCEAALSTHRLRRVRYVLPLSPLPKRFAPGARPERPTIHQTQLLSDLFLSYRPAAFDEDGTGVTFGRSNHKCSSSSDQHPTGNNPWDCSIHVPSPDGFGSSPRSGWLGKHAVIKAGLSVLVLT